MSKIKVMLNDAVNRVAMARKRRRTARILEDLPDYIRKDIGWSASWQ